MCPQGFDQNVIQNIHSTSHRLRSIRFYHLQSLRASRPSWSYNMCAIRHTPYANINLYGPYWVCLRNRFLTFAGGSSG